MNTPSQAYYEQARPRVFQQGATWSELKNPDEGVATFFLALCDAMRGRRCQRHLFAGPRLPAAGLA